MRPEILAPLFRSAASLDGIGAKLETALTRLLVDSGETRPVQIRDLIFHLPFSYIDRRYQPKIGESKHGEIATLKIFVDRHKTAPRRGRIPHKVFGSDETGELEIVFFHGHGDWLKRTLPVGEHRYVSGRIEWYNDRPQMVHPDHIVDEEQFTNLAMVEPIYSAGQGVSQKVIQRSASSALSHLLDLPEWQDEPFRKEHKFPPLKEALTSLHKPQDLPPSLDHPALSRLAYDELLASQLALALVRRHMRRSAGRAHQFTGHLAQKIVNALPFSLTDSQQCSLAEITEDLKDDQRMLRLLQGDVGSGKTIVALLAMANVVEAGAQAVMMAPTELLARQHQATIEGFANEAGLTSTILTGSMTARERKSVLAGLKEGSVNIIVGTHALFQSGAEFANLGLVIVDEQHRFGVHQRLALTAKGRSPDVLVMTATPIPRTLVLTYFGDMDVSKLKEKPAGRKPISTRSIPLEKLNDLVTGIRRQITDGHKIYWVCPLVEQSDLLPVMPAEERYAQLQAVFGDDQMGLIHGRMDRKEKEETMNSFRSGSTRILVATTVIEVGVDVPDASVIVIEHAERFGLAQLHQLRGRVGRGNTQSFCILLYRSPLGETAKARLSIMRETEDGFKIAEEDLRLRGEGEVLGIRQSGTPGFQLAKLEIHQNLLEIARVDTKLILETDPHLKTKRGEALRILLYLFGKDKAIQLLQAG